MTTLKRSEKIICRLSVVISNPAKLGLWVIFWHREHKTSPILALSGSTGSPEGPQQVTTSLGTPTRRKGLKTAMNQGESAPSWL